MYSFRQALTARQHAIDSLVCVGLDPMLDNMPERFRKKGVPLSESLFQWMKWIVDITYPFASMFKPQHAHWAAIPGGLRALRRIINHIHKCYPGIPVFIDCKRGDIDRTQDRYRVAHIVLEHADGMNYNGYMGKSTLASLVNLKYPGRAFVGLGRTSNKEAWVVQDRVGADGLTLWEFMVDLQYRWSIELGVIGDAGIVMGAAYQDPNDPSKIYSYHLTLARNIVGNDMWFLIPGIGTQGGFVDETVRTSYRGPGSVAINSSSGITESPSPAGKAEELRDQINHSRYPQESAGN